MRLAGFELRKLLCQKSLVVIFVICAMVNLLLLSFQGAGSYTPGMYLALMEDLSGMTAEDARDRVYEKREVLQEYIFRAEAEYDGEAAEEMVPYTGDVWMERDLLDDVLEELGKVAGYQDYLAGIQEDASDMMSVSIFRESAGFSTRNIEKTAEDFAGLSDIDPVPDVSAGVVMAAGQDATDFIMVFFLAALSVFLVMGEKQAGLLMLTAPTERGRQRTAAAKMAAMAVVMVIAMAVLYGENFILAAERYGFGDLSRPVQSVGDYQSCILEVSVGQFFILYLAGKLLLYLVFCLIFFFICLLGKSMLQMILVCIAVLGGSAALYFLVAENSAFMALRYLNLFYFLQTDRLLTAYKNVNLFGQPVSLLAAAMVLLTAAAAVFAALSIAAVRGCRFLQTVGGKGLSRKRKLRQRTGSITGFEYLKLMGKNGVVWILLLFAAVQAYRIHDYHYFVQADDIYYKIYMDYLSGPVTEKTTAYVEEENARYAGLYEELAGTEDIVRQSEIGQELLPAEGWGQAVTEYERILEAGDADGAKLSLVYPGGYYKLMGQDGQRDMVCASLLGVLFCICLAAVFAGDAGCGMDRLIFTTAGGRRDTLRAKKQVSFVTAFLIFVLVYGGDFLMILLKIGMKEWQAPLRSLADFSLCPPDVRLWQYMALLYLVKFAGMWACLCVMRVISFLCRDTFRTVLVSAIVFVLPALVGLLGIDAVNYISLVPLLTGSGILNGFLEGSRILYGILYLLAAAGIIGLSGWYLGRQMRETC